MLFSFVSFDPDLGLLPVLAHQQRPSRPLPLSYQPVGERNCRAMVDYWRGMSSSYAFVVALRPLDWSPARCSPGQSSGRGYSYQHRSRAGPQRESLPNCYYRLLKFEAICVLGGLLKNGCTFLDSSRCMAVCTTVRAIDLG